jgi:RimJ/RimL family protein N-acetyltransferase
VLVRLRQEVQEVPRRLTPPDPPLQNDRIRLDPIAHSHHDGLWRLAQQRSVERYTFVPTNATEEFVPAWIQRYVDGWAEGTRAGFVVLDALDGTFLGFGSIVQLDLDARQGEIGYALLEESRGRGAASGAVDLLTRWGFDELGLERLELHIDATNVASQRVAERCGYRLDGVLRNLHFKEGRRCDLGIWSRLPSDPA